MGVPRRSETLPLEMSRCRTWESILAITDPQTPKFGIQGNPTKSCFALQKKEFHRQFPMTNSKKEFFSQTEKYGSGGMHIVDSRRLPNLQHNEAGETRSWGMCPAEIAPRRILEFVLVSEVKEALEENITEDLVKNKQT